MLVRYWNSDKYKVSFLGVPKCGSSTVRKLLDCNPEKDWTLEPKYSTTITLLRHPYSRVVSGYHECDRMGILKAKGVENFEQFIYAIENLGYFNEHIEPMAAYFKECDKVLIMENDFINDLGDFLGEELPFEQENKTKYNKIEGFEDRIRVLYPMDYELYNTYSNMNN